MTNREPAKGIIVPKREDERQLSLSGRHPVYCTCTECTDRLLNKKNIKSKKASWKKLFGGEKVKPHPANCSCATCNLLRSVDGLQPIGKPKSGLLRRLFGKR
jgi:hypothetical protein